MPTRSYYLNSKVSNSDKHYKPILYKNPLVFEVGTEIVRCTKKIIMHPSVRNKLICDLFHASPVVLTPLAITYEALL
jgi:hypothetical protein